MIVKKINWWKLYSGVILTIIGFILRDYHTLYGAIAVIGVMIIITSKERSRKWFCVNCGQSVTLTKLNGSDPPVGKCKKCGCETLSRKIRKLPRKIKIRS